MSKVKARKINIVSFAVALALLSAFFVSASPATASTNSIALGDAESFAVFAGTTVTAAGTSIITGNLGVSPGTAVTGFPPSQATGSIHLNDSLAKNAQKSVQIAYNDAVSRMPTQIVGVADLSAAGSAGVLSPGVYSSPSSLSLTGTLTLDGLGDSTSVFIFQAGSTLITSTASEIVLINGAQAGNIFWQVGSSATLGTNAIFSGTILAHTSITANAGVQATGRFLSLGAAMTLGAGANVTTPTPLPPVAPSDQKCDELGYEAKIDTTGDPVTVSVLAPTGFLIDSYCVKAGTTKVIVPVNPPQATVIVDHPGKDSVSHYQVRLIKTPTVDPKDTYEVGFYIYKKLNPSLPAAWPNSGKQTFVASQLGTDWFIVFPGKLPENVCGPGWGIQQDKVKHDGSFTWPQNITYPNDNIGWPPIYAAKHQELDEFFKDSGGVPDCILPQPPADVETVKVVVPVTTYDCESLIATTTTTTTTTVRTFTYILVGRVWIRDGGVDVVSSTSISETRPLTSGEVANVVCPVTPPVEPPPVAAVPTVDTPATPETLAVTGATNTIPAMLLALLLMLAGLAATMFVKRKQGTHRGNL